LSLKVVELLKLLGPLTTHYHLLEQW